MCKRSTRIWSILLVIILLINMLPAQAMAIENDSASESNITVDENVSTEDLYVVDEVVDQRTEYTKVYRMSNGLHMASVYAYPVHYEENGEWKEIDNTLKLTNARSGNTYNNTAGVWDVSFPQSMTKDSPISITKDGHTLSFRMTGEMHNGDSKLQFEESETIELPTTPDEPILELQGESIAAEDAAAPEAAGAIGGTITLTAPAEVVTAAVETPDIQSVKAVEEYPEMVPDKLGSRLRYDGIYENTDLIFDLTSSLVKESVVLNEYRDSLLGYTYTLNTGDMVPSLQENGAIELRDPESNEVIMFMPAPYLIDGTDETCYDVEVSLAGKDGSYILTYTLPREWLAEENRQWPVILDPVVLPSMSITNIYDVTIGSGGYANYASEYLYCGYYAGNSNFLKSWIFLKYGELPELTASDVIIDAKVRLNTTSGNYDKEKPLPVVEVHKVKTPWGNKTINWDNKPEFDERVEDYTLVYPGTGHQYWNVTNIVREWYETGVNTGMMFKIPNDTEDKQKLYHKFCSSEHSSYYYYTRPYLTITYRNSNGLESYWNYTSSSAGRAGTGYVNQYTGKLVWSRNDIGFSGNRMPVSISHVYNSNNHLDNSYGMGYGWKTNFNQQIYHWSPAGTGVGYCVWEDGDGTTHYFVKVATGIYADEDGLEMVATNTGTGKRKYKITDKYGNCSYFDTKGRLTEQVNNQKTESNILITYTSADSSLISTITDGVGRIYTFTYNDNNLLDKISYAGTGTTELAYINFSYDENQNLTTVTDQDSLSSTYSYGDNHLLLSAQDIDGYKVSYTYTTIVAGIPNRIASISESHNNSNGRTLGLEYARNQTRLTENPGDTSSEPKNVQVIQFNNMGNAVSVQDGQGHAQFSQFAINSPETDETSTESDGTSTASVTASTDNPKANQLKLASKLQNTVTNLLMDSSFENSTLWTAFGSSIAQSIDSSISYLGAKSLKIVSLGTDSEAGVSSEAFTVESGATYTFSAYVKVDSNAAYLAIKDGTATTHESESLDVVGEWKRLEVSYTNNFDTDKSVTAQLITNDDNTVYMDCVQLEKAPTASRYNLIQNGDFAMVNYAWSSDEGRITADSKAPATQLDEYVYTMTGNPGAENRISQTVNVSGQEGDTFVLAGWAKADSVPILDSREFGLIATFMNGETEVNSAKVRFNAAVDSTIEWQYTAEPILADGIYDSILIEIAYDYNANTAYFDGIQLFKEEFGQSYTYDEDGNVISVKDVRSQMTEYEYTTNDLTKEILPNGATLEYTYDKYHNVKTAKTDSGIEYSFEYDEYGNNTKVSITSNGVTLTSSATYTSDGNYLVSTTDAVGNTTTYEYDIDTGVLHSVTYPDDDHPGYNFFDISGSIVDTPVININTSARKTVYTYDDMYRLATASQAIDEDTTLTASYTYENDLLTEITTGSTTYTFGYGDFSLRRTIKVGTNTLATYTYTENDHYLSKLEYGNRDSVSYVYDDYGRLTTQTYEDGDTVAYQYDNNGALATVTDSGSGIKTTYYYDLTDRLMRYVEKGTEFSHIVGYEYDLLNNLTALIEAINGIKYATAYTYDKDNRITSIIGGLRGDTQDGSIEINGATIKDYTYDEFGRVSEQVTSRYDGAYVIPAPTEAPTEPSEAPTEPTEDPDKETFKTDTFQFTAPDVLTTDGTTRTSSQVSAHSIRAGERENETTQATEYAYDKTFTYTYDANGNILTVSDGTNTTTYTYDYANQLIREDNEAINLSWTWEYDDAGNILSRKQYAYTAGVLGDVTNTVDYTYGDSQWGDLLTGYGDSTITSDSIGNMTSFGGWTFTWEHGRELASLSKDGTTWTNTYNADGLRTKRTNGSTTYNYVYNGSSLSQMSVGTHLLNFVYDANGAPMAVNYDGTTYYYVTNLQGDVIAILDSEGKAVVEYTYDAWGKHWETAGDMATTLGVHNPLRYRGYVYDPETSLYYLQSRYYDPEIGRWINADGFVSTGQDITGYNMFAYCGNNPVNRVDPTGQFWKELWDAFTQAIQQASGYFAVAAGITQVDSPAPGPADVVGTAMAVGGLFVCATIAVESIIFAKPTSDIFSNTDEKAQAIAITRGPDNPVIFPSNPNDFNPIGLIKVPRAGTKNGAFISWMDPLGKTEVFRWDENPNYPNGPHYHILGTGHYYPGDIVPEPFATIYFPFR